MKIFNLKRSFDFWKITLFNHVFEFPIEPKRPTTYPKIIRRLKHKKEKIVVAFLVNEAAKWQYQSLYEELEKNDKFQPVILVTKVFTPRKRENIYYQSFDECVTFFKDKGFEVKLAYNPDTQKYTSLKKFKPDILFYQQPWLLHPLQNIDRVCKFALPCYNGYGLHLDTFWNDYFLYFQKMLWAYFVENEELISFYHENNIFTENMHAIGALKLDRYFRYHNVSFIAQKKPTVIYAPHHSVETYGLNCASFRENGQDILALAQKTKDKINWIFKPHPRLRYALTVNQIMTKQEIDDYYKQWQTLGTFYDGGDYIPLFLQSNALITDCISFLGEYLPSRKPILHLIGPKYPFNQVYLPLLNTYYKIKSMTELKETLERVVLNEDDYMKNDRLKFLPFLFNPKQKATCKLIDILTKLCA